MNTVETIKQLIAELPASPILDKLQDVIELLIARVRELEKAKNFVSDVAKQTPEKPDYWSSCSQCERNSSEAEEIIEQIDAARGGDTK